MSNELFQQRISCVVCEQPLPPKRHEDEDDPGYFAAGSGGYKPGEEAERSCEDFTQLLNHLQTLNETIWSELEHMRETEKADAARPAGEQPTGVHGHIDRIRSLCRLFRDVQEEFERRFKLFDRWVDAQWHEHNPRQH